MDRQCDQYLKQSGKALWRGRNGKFFSSSFVLGLCAIGVAIFFALGEKLFSYYLTNFVITNPRRSTIFIDLDTPYLVTGQRLFPQKGSGPKRAMSCRIQGILIGQSVLPWNRELGAGSLSQGAWAREPRPGSLGQVAWAR